RMALLLAGLPVEVHGQTLNRLCGSGLQAAASAAQAIKAGEGDVFVAGGVENMTRAPYVTLKSGEAWSRKAPETADTTVGWRFTNPRLKQDWTISLGETAASRHERTEDTTRCCASTAPHRWALGCACEAEGRTSRHGAGQRAGRECRCGGAAGLAVGGPAGWGGWQQEDNRPQIARRGG